MKLKTTDSRVPIFSSLVDKLREYKSVGRGFQIPSTSLLPNYNTKPSYQSSAKESYRRLRESDWTTSCIGAYQRALTPFKFIAQRWDEEAREWVHEPDHAIERVMDTPNKYQSSIELIQSIATNVLSTGNALVAIKDSRTLKKTMSLESLDVDGAQPVLNPIDLIEGYKVKKSSWGIRSSLGAHNSKLEKFVKRENMVHIRIVNPDDPTWGISPLEAAKNIQDASVLAMEWNRNLMQNSGRPSFVLTTEHGLSSRTRREITKALVEDTTRDSIGLPLVLMHGLKPVSIGKTPVDLDIVDSAYLDCERICALLGVPPAVIGISKNATLANVREYYRAFYTNSVIPLIRVICEAMSHSWVQPRYGINYRLWFDDTDVSELKEDMQVKVGVVPVLFDKGYSMNELNRVLKLGLPETEVGNIRQVSGHIVDDAGFEFTLPVAPGGAPNGSGIGQGENETGGTVGLRPDVTGDVNDPTPKSPVARKKPFGRKARSGPKPSEKELVRISKIIEQEREVLVETHRIRVFKALSREFKKLVENLAVLVPNEVTLDEVRERKLPDYAKPCVKECAAGFARDTSRVWNHSVKTAFDSFASKYGVNLKSSRKSYFGMEDDLAIALFTTLTAEEIMTTASHWVIGKVAVMLQQGDKTKEQMVATLLQELPELTKFKAEVIVENEILASTNYAHSVGAERSGVYTVKRWHTLRDDRVRPSHVQMEGEEQLLSDLYSNGLRYPRDPEGSAKETVNCRCFETYA